MLVDRLLEEASRYRLALRFGDQGRVGAVGDGIAWVYGLPTAPAESLIGFEDGSRGLVFDLQADRVGVILLDPQAQVTSGSLATRAADRLEIATGDALLGRVVDPLGRPLDGLPPPRADARRPLEAASPPILARDFVRRPLHTGIKVIDTLVPIGRGQRQLILGDAGTGKSALTTDIVVAQRDQAVRCVYVCIGQKRAEVARLVATLRRTGADAWTTVVVAAADATPGMKYLAPFAGCAIAETWMRRGEDTLLVLDDLTTHARAYRELSLLMHRPPGREAYPGDIFYLHARLLERATCLAEREGGGSLTALPIVELEEGEIAAFIPTNLVSITDGQIYLDGRLFEAGVLPAIDVGLSVSRIGGKAQPPAIAREAGRLRLEYLQFLELEPFTRFGARLDPGTEAKIRRGRVLRAIFRQDRLAPVPVALDLAWMIAFAEGLIDEPGAVPTALERLAAACAASPLPLAADREAWVGLARTALGGPR